MSINLIQLKDEIQNDPEGLGYSVPLSIRNDIGIAEILNTVRNESNYIVSKGRISKDTFLEDTADIVFNLMVLEDAGSSKATFWLKVFDRLVANADTINSEDPTLINLLDQMIIDNVITQQDKETTLTRFGSRAEVLFSCNVTIDQVSDSLNEVNE
jgi:hypothetical protein